MGWRTDLLQRLHGQLVKVERGVREAVLYNTVVGQLLQDVGRKLGVPTLLICQTGLVKLVAEGEALGIGEVYVCLAL